MLVPSLEKTGQQQRLVRHPIALLRDQTGEVGEAAEVVVNLSPQIAATICRVVVRSHCLHLVEEVVGQFDSGVDSDLTNREGNPLPNERYLLYHAVVPRRLREGAEEEEEIEVVAADVVASEVEDGRSTTLVVYYEHLYEYHTLYISHRDAVP